MLRICFAYAIFKTWFLDLLGGRIFQSFSNNFSDMGASHNLLVYGSRGTSAHTIPKWQPVGTDNSRVKERIHTRDHLGSIFWPGTRALYIIYFLCISKFISLAWVLWGPGMVCIVVAHPSPHPTPRPRPWAQREQRKAKIRYKYIYEYARHIFIDHIFTAQFLA